MSESNSSISMKPPVFSGKACDFPAYWLQLEAFASYTGTSEGLLESFESKLPVSHDVTLDESDATEKEQIRAKVTNAKLMTAIILGQKSKDMINAIALSHSKEWPMGKAWMVAKEFKARFQPRDDLAEVEMEEALLKIKLGKNEDPKKLNDKIAEIQIKYSCSISDERKCVTIMKAARQQYASSLAMYKMQVHMKHGRNPNSTEYLEAMHYEWRIRGDSYNQRDEPTETALSNASGKSGRKCFKCGEAGHFARDCKKPDADAQKQSSNKTRFKGDCNLCGRTGHMKKDCYEDEKNASKRPRNWKSRLNGNNDKSGACVEILIPSVGVFDGIEENATELFLTSVHTDMPPLTSKVIMERKVSEESMDLDCGIPLGCEESQFTGCVGNWDVKPADDDENGQPNPGSEGGDGRSMPRVMKSKMEAELEDIRAEYPFLLNEWTQKDEDDHKRRINECVDKWNALSDEYHAEMDAMRSQWAAEMAAEMERLHKGTEEKYSSLLKFESSEEVQRVTSNNDVMQVATQSGGNRENEEREEIDIFEETSVGSSLVNEDDARQWRASLPQTNVADLNELGVYMSVGFCNGSVNANESSDISIATTASNDLGRDEAMAAVEAIDGESPCLIQQARLIQGFESGANESFDMSVYASEFELGSVSTEETSIMDTDSFVSCSSGNFTPRNDQAINQYWKEVFDNVLVSSELQAKAPLISKGCSITAFGQDDSPQDPRLYGKQFGLCWECEPWNETEDFRHGA